MIDVLNNLLVALDHHGPMVVMVAALLTVNGFFIWRDYRREQSQQKQINELQRHMNDVVIPIVTESREAIARCTEVISQNSEVILRLVGSHARKS